MGKATSKTKVGVVIPTLDEEPRLRRHLPTIVEAADLVVVCDGGSGDGTRETAASLGARVVTSSPGRGRQLNAGAQAVAASGADVLLFLHADTALEPEAFSALRRAVEEGAIGGGFLCRFDNEKPIYRLGESLVNLRTRVTRSPLGDQAQFATRSAFEALGGFRDWPLLEDLDFVRRLKKHGPVAVLAPPALTSARRYEERGIGRTILRNWLIFGLYLLGVAPERLARLY